MKLPSPTITILGQDPNRSHRINANSFQQNAITAVKGWQYAAFYTAVLPGKSGSGCRVNLARRQLPLDQVEASTTEWQVLTFEDYEQTRDDGHDTISIGVCEGDGTIHVAFDHHCDQLKFRMSKIDVASNPSSHVWVTSLFTETRSYLPGIETGDLLKEVTYPRFVAIGKDLLFTHRTGQAGLGSDLLHRYSSSSHQYTLIGQHLMGVANSPYINGIDYRKDRLHISWCYRKFVITQSPVVTPHVHQQQSGPNGPENNYDLYYAFSDDRGVTWKNSEGRVIACMTGGDGIETSSIKPGVDIARVYEIPMGSGILNQEGQAADWDGGFWVLNREKVGGEERWIVYYRNPEGTWTRMVIDSVPEPTETGSRGSVCTDRKGDVYLVLPGNSDPSLNIMRARKEEQYSRFEPVWMLDGYDGEPLVDVQRLETSDVLSVFTRTSAGVDGKRDVVVLDLLLTEL
ncbi:hypothetical protein ONS95_008027 [Cadophora gregata]|uniref:uncharacterized protein n=1 Tax=Cadophora gregata TaxID=51156 RepID=UPI0026DA9225|nr:uncharacterized protein ONS95_008027 [Cadophora gregata]KAK0119169.1 hypothetical protein ONS96_012233 [Cadophora gregata f. sp. sojae]KAK0126427.1 hypothetical protein ONS95_008027 [Cadophora gregata]